jgi:hypothetical protein
MKIFKNLLFIGVSTTNMQNISNVSGRLSKSFILPKNNENNINFKSKSTSFFDLYINMKFEDSLNFSGNDIYVLLYSKSHFQLQQLEDIFLVP